MSSPIALETQAYVPVDDGLRLDRISAALGEIADHSLTGGADGEVLDRVAVAFRLQAQVDALLLDAVGEVEARDLARERGCVSTRSWLRSAHRRHPGESTALVRTARSLRSSLPATRAAMGAGDVSLDQVRVIATALETAARDLPAEKIAVGEAALVRAAADLDPSRLAVLGRRVAELVDPAGTQDRDQARAQEAEDRASDKRTATLTPYGDRPGGRLSARLDAHGYATLAAWLDAAAAPTPASTDPDAIPDDRHPGQRRADALVEACAQALAAGGQDARGGVKPRIVVTIPARTLATLGTEHGNAAETGTTTTSTGHPDTGHATTGFAQTSTGQSISLALARLLACDADIIAACVRDDGTLLDAGRTRRRFTGKLRLALDLRDRGCAFPSCDRPVSWTQAHHIVSWLDGGLTDQRNGVLLCWHHHRLVEGGDWAIEIRGGRAWFQPPLHIDPGQRWRLNRMHHPPDIEIPVPA